MAKLVLSMDGLVLKEIPLTKERTTIGRKPHNDIQIDNLAISGDHAAIVTILKDSFLEDLNSTNGTYVNGKAIKKQLLQGGDSIEIGKYKIKFVHDGPSSSQERTTVINSGAVVQPDPGLPSAAIKVMSGAAAGREVPLVKVVTTIGKPGVAVAAITRRPHGYVVALVEGATPPTVNGQPLSTEAVQLHNGDLLELAGTQMQFIQTA